MPSRPFQLVPGAIGKEFPFSEARHYTDIAAQRKRGFGTELLPIRLHFRHDCAA
jgi:hypothetical protein